MKLRDKRAVGLNDMYPAVLMIVLVGIILGVGLFVLSQTQLGMSDTRTVVNETLTPTGLAVAVAKATDCGFTSFAVTSVWNHTVLLDANNYTYNANSGTVTNLSSEHSGGAYNVSYTYKSGEDNVASSNYCDSIGTTISGAGNFSTWIAVIVVVLAAAIVLGIVLSSFAPENRV